MRKTARQATGAPTRTPIPAVASLRVDPERLAADVGDRAQRSGSRLPGAASSRSARCSAGPPAGRDEVPLVDGEFFFITALSADTESDDDAGDG